MPLILLLFVVLCPTLTNSQEWWNLAWSCISTNAMVYWLVLPFVERVSLTRFCILSSRLATIYWLQLLLLKPRRIRMWLRPSSKLLLLMLRNSVWVIPRYSLELVFWVTWKRFVKIGLVRYYLGYKPKQEANNLVLFSRSFKIKSLHSIVCK